MFGRWSTGAAGFVATGLLIAALGSGLVSRSVAGESMRLEEMPRKVPGFQVQGEEEVERIPPLSREIFGHLQEVSGTLVVEPPEVDRLRFEDEMSREEGDPRIRTGVAVPVDHDPTDPGAWMDDGRGGRFWAMEILAPGASTMRVHFDGFDLPRDARVVIYPASDPESVFGPYQHRGVSDTTGFWSHVVETDHLIVEYHEVKSTATSEEDSKIPFQVDEVLYGYRSVSSFLGDLSCQLDISCYSEYATLREAGAIVFFVDSTGGHACSGSLLTTIAFDRTPFLATAFHCINSSSVAATADVIWRYRSNSCNGSVPALNSLPHSLGATFHDFHVATDFTLLMVEGVVPRTAYWAGWDASAQPVGEGVTSIHHPLGSHQRISFGTVQSGCSSSFNCVKWVSGVTALGSSGSPLYNDQDLFTGVLNGGTSACNNPNGIDEYGRFDQAFGSVGSAFIIGSDDAFEPNDDTNNLARLDPGTHRDLVVKVDDEDWYEITLAPYERADIDIEFTDLTGNITVWAYNPQGGIEDVGATSTDDEHISIENLTGSFRDYRVRVFLSDDTRQTYDIDFSLSPCGVSDDIYENNDLCPSARQMDHRVFDELYVSRTDEDWYRILVPAYSEVSVRVHHNHDRGDIDLEAFDDCGGNLVDESKTVSDTESVDLVNSTGATQFYRVRTYIYPFGPGDCSVYQLDIDVDRCVSDDSYEPDDTCFAGTLIGEGTIQDLQALPADPDWFKVIVPSGGTLDVDVLFNHLLDDIDVRLYKVHGSTPVDESLTMTSNEHVTVRNLSGADVLYSTEVRLVSGDCNQYDVDVDINPNRAPATPGRPVGPSTGWELSVATFTMSTTDPDFDSLVYTVDWGDGTQSETSSRPSGVPALIFHSYADEGIYSVRVKARDPFGLETPFSAPHMIDIADVDNRAGTVGLDDGQGPVDVLRVNGSPGFGSRRTLTVNAGTSLNVTLDAAPFGPVAAIYGVWGWAFKPGANDLRVLPQSLGALGADPLLQSCAQRCPTYAAVTLPPLHCSKVPCSTPEASNLAPPATILGISSGILQAGQTIYFQGVIRDDSDTSGRRFSVTNAVEVTAQ